MSRADSKNIDFMVRIMFETPKAYLVTEDDDREIWIPKSQVVSMEISDEDPKYATMTISEWLAKEKELI